jgi:hypothetical protein
MKRGLLHLPKTSLTGLLTQLPEKDFSLLRKKLTSAQQSNEEPIAIEVSSEELETLLDRLPRGELRDQILQTYQSF